MCRRPSPSSVDGMARSHRFSLFDTLIVLAVAVCAVIAFRPAHARPEAPAPEGGPTPAIVARNQPIRMTAAGDYLYWTTSAAPCAAATAGRRAR